MKLIRIQHGRSLVELMIALTIGMIIMLAVSSLFVSTNSTNRVSDQRVRMEEDGRLALNLLAFHIRMAGYGQLINPENTNSFIQRTNFESKIDAPTNEGLQGCLGGFATASAVTFTCNDSASKPDSLIVRYIVDRDNANINSTASKPTDCLGQAVDENSIVENRFYIDTNASSSLPELYCIGNGGTAVGAAGFANSGQPVMENIVDMKLTYGYGTLDQQVVDSFLSASVISQRAASAAAAQPANSAGAVTPWGRVVQVKVCLIVRSASDNIAPEPVRYTNCSGQNTLATDRRLYKAFSSVVTIRNRGMGV